MLGFNPPLNEYPSSKGGEPPLHRAARTGDCAEIRRLVAAGEKLDSTFNSEPDPEAYERNATPFMIAAGSSDGANVETLRVLLELGADPKAIIEQRSAATFACNGLSWQDKTGGDAERLRFVLQAGCPLPTDPEQANRLLCDTAATGDPERLRVLLEHGLNARGHWDPVKSAEIHRRVKEDLAQSRDGEPDIFASLPEDLRQSMANAVQGLSGLIYDQIGSAPSSDAIPLFRAAKSGNADCVRLLLASGADIKARDSWKSSAIYYAGSAEVARMFIQAGLPLEDANSFGQTPLESAMSDGESALPRVQALIEAGANINATHDHGYTVFMSAVGSNRYPALLRLLVASGADPHAISEFGYNAFHAAIDVNSDANAEESVRDTFGYLKQLGVDIEHRNKENQTPLSRAIQSGTGLEVSVLCELGADPNAVCPKHECGGEACTSVDQPLIFDAADGHGVHKDAKTEALLRAGADPLVKDAEGFTPVMRIMTSLCREAADHDTPYQAFFAGLRDLPLENKPMPQTRDEFVAHATPILRAYIERFAAEIPVPEVIPEYDAEWRKEKLSCIVLLCAYTAWAQHENRRHRET